MYRINSKTLIILASIIAAIVVIVGVVCMVIIFTGNSDETVAETNTNFSDYEENNNRTTTTTTNNTSTSTNMQFNNTAENNNMSVTNLASDKYYYKQLDEYGRIIYDTLEDNKENLKTGTYEMDLSTTFNRLLSTEDGEETLKIAYQSAWNAFSYDNVDLFYLDITKLQMMIEHETNFVETIYKVKIGRGDNATYLSEDFADETAVEEAEQYMENIRNQVVTALSGYSNEEKIKRVNDWMIDNLTYDQSSGENKYNIYGAITEAKAVCEGYARMFKYIMDGMNIPCILVSGEATNSNGDSESHAWNYVQLDGGWYAVDVTWNDPVIIGGGEPSEEQRTRYLLKGQSFLQDHKEDGLFSENSMKFSFPKLVEDE